MKNSSITNIQQARAIIKAVGEKHQYYVSEMLRGLTWNISELSYERDAQEVINYMENEYVLNVANVLWMEKYEQIPNHIKSW